MEFIVNLVTSPAKPASYHLSSYRGRSILPLFLINANLSLSIFFLPFCSFIFLLHIQYAGILRRGYFFADFFCVLNLPEFRLEFGWLYNCIYYQTALPQENEIARLNVANEYWFSPAGNFAGCKFTGFVNYSKNKHLANSCR